MSVNGQKWTQMNLLFFHHIIVHKGFQAKQAPENVHPDFFHQMDI